MFLSIFLDMSLCLYLYMSLYLFLFASIGFFCFLCFPLFPFSFAFSPFLLPVSFVVSLLCFFFSSSIFFFLSISFFPLRPVFVSCVHLALASFLALVSSPSCSSFFLPFGCYMSLSPLPSSVPLPSSSVFFFFSSLLVILSTFFSSSSFLSYCPVLLFSPLSLLLFLLFLVLQLFLFFVFSTSITCFFRSFCCHFLHLSLHSFFFLRLPFFSSSSLFLWV